MSKAIASTISKIFVAGYWVTAGEPDKGRLESLKELLDAQPKFSKEDWASVEIYSHSRPKENELMQLLDVLKNCIREEYEREFALKTLQKVCRIMFGAAANEIEGKKEQQLIRAVIDTVTKVSSGIEDKLEGFFVKTGLTRTPFAQKKAQAEAAPRRERDVEELVENPILYHALQSITQKGVALHMNKSELEKLCVAGALMAVIAQADGEIHPDEVVTIKDALQKHWRIGDDAAIIISEIAVDTKVAGMDIHKNCKKFYAATDAQDRADFMNALVEVIVSDYDVDANEIARLREIGTNLRISPDKLSAMIPAVGPIERPPEEDPEDELGEDDGHESFSSFFGRGA